MLEQIEAMSQKLSKEKAIPVNRYKKSIHLQEEPY
jgi:hypothetical protein